MSGHFILSLLMLCLKTIFYVRVFFFSTWHLCFICWCTDWGGTEGLRKWRACKSLTVLLLLGVLFYLKHYNFASKSLFCQECLCCKTHKHVSSLPQKVFLMIFHTNTLILNQLFLKKNLQVTEQQREKNNKELLTSSTLKIGGLFWFGSSLYWFVVVCLLRKKIIHIWLSDLIFDSFQIIISKRKIKFLIKL